MGEFARQSPKRDSNVIIKAANVTAEYWKHRVAVHKVEAQTSKIESLLTSVWRCTNGHWKHHTRVWRFQPQYHVEFTTTKSMHHNGDKIGTLEMQTSQQVQMVPRAKTKVSMISATTVGSQVIRPSFVVQRVEKQKKGSEKRQQRLELRLGATKASRNEHLQRDSQYDVHVNRENRDHSRQKSNSLLIQRKRTETRTQHQIVWDHQCPTWKTVETTNSVVVRLVTLREAKCTFSQLERRTHQFFQKKRLGAVAKASGCRLRSWRNRDESRLADKPPFTESDGSRANDFYTTADGSKMYNEGHRKLDFCTLDDQQRRSMTFQVVRMKKALGSVRQIVKNGNKLF